MAIGRVKWYNKSNGYGFIESPEGDVFFHFSDILMEGFKALAEDQRKVSRWVETQGAAEVFFDPVEIGGKRVDPFFNINRPEDLDAAEALLKRTF